MALVGGTVFAVGPMRGVMPYAGGRRATKPAHQEASFDTSDLITTAIDSETVLNDLRGKR